MAVVILAGTGEVQEGLGGIALAVGGTRADRLRSFIERVEKLEEEKAAITGDIKDVYAEAKGVGFDTPTMRQIVKLRKMDRADRTEQEAMLDLYKRALDMSFDDTPLGAYGDRDAA